MTVYLAAAPENMSCAFGLGYPLAYMAYRIGKGFHLYRASTPVNMRGGIMAIDNAGFAGSGPHAPLVSEIIRECIVRHFSGIMLNVQENPSPTIIHFAAALAIACEKNDLCLYVPPHISDCAKTAYVLVGTAISGGTLTRRITDAENTYGAGRIALDIERTCMDFTLPAVNGNGIPLSYEELNGLMQRYRSQPFFSKELCAFYFTYRLNGKSHFVLFDNAQSLQKKIAVGERMGIKASFLFYPDIADMTENFKQK